MSVEQWHLFNFKSCGSLHGPHRAGLTHYSSGCYDKQTAARMQLRPTKNVFNPKFWYKEKLTNIKKNKTRIDFARIHFALNKTMEANYGKSLTLSL